MANDCYFKKYKKVVNNDSLKKYGELVIRFTKSYSSPIAISLGSLDDAEIIGSGYFTNQAGTENYGKTFTKSAASQYKFYVKATGACSMRAISKYDLTHLTISPDERVCEVDVDDIVFIPNGNALEADMLVGDWNKLKGKAFTSFMSYYRIPQQAKELAESILTNSQSLTKLFMPALSTAGQLLLNMDTLEGHSAITSLRFDGIYGDVKYLGDLSLLDYVAFYVNTADADNINGSIESIVARKIARGVTTGSMKIFKDGFKNITYNDIPLFENPAVPSSANVTFTWDAQGNITWS